MRAENRKRRRGEVFRGLGAAAAAEGGLESVDFLDAPIAAGVRKRRGMGKNAIIAKPARDFAALRAF